MDMFAAGDEDRWMLLQRLSDGGQPIVVRTRINPEIHEFARSNRISAVICDVDPPLVSEHGMPLCLDVLYDLEDRIVALADSLGKAYHTASATGDARRTIYIAHSADTKIESVVDLIQAEGTTIWTTDDFAFDSYEEYVIPTPLDIQIDGDQGVISSLQKHGDNGSEPRKIDFWFYGDHSSLENLARRLAGEGMVIDHWLDGDRTGLVLSENAQATFEHFQDLTPTILEASQAAGVEYDGWETMVLATAVEESAQPPRKSLLKRLFRKTKE
ncbi:ribonuclease E inhibitor RraB [Altererythrobacter fulvus]|uniref:ribonuclease E inhibitor RraB n=1 Tax=Caenibius fulvus TaxID=2126012 RepID=UPI00301B59BD